MLMENLIQKIIMEYTQYLREKAMYDKHLEIRENYDMREALTIIDIKISIIESWFALLDLQERFAFRQALQGTQNDTATMQSAAMILMWRISMDGCTPWQARERAITKIVEFSSEHMEMMQDIFIKKA